MSKPSGDLYSFGSFRLNTAEKKLYSEGHPIPLSTVQFDTLRVLVEHEGKLVDKDLLARRVFGENYSDPRAIEKPIYDLRGKLHDSSKRLIKTEPGGYCIGEPVRKGPETPNALEDPLNERRPATIESQSEITQLDVRIVSPESAEGAIITFRELWRGPSEVVRWLLLTGVILTIALSFVLLVYSAETRKWSRLFVSITQASVLLAALVGSLSRPRGFNQIKDYSDRIAQEVSELSIKYWRAILLTWILLYVVLAFKVHPDIESTATSAGMGFMSWKAFSIINDLINNFNTLLVILCYDVLRRPMEVRNGKPAGDAIRLSIGSAFILVFLALEIFSVMPASTGNIKDVENVLSAWSLVSGIAGGIAVALFVGRLQSMFLGPPRLLIIALYSYIAIQPLYEHFGGHQNDAEIRNAVILINAALILKCLLYFYLALLFKSGRLLFYLVSVRRTYQRVGTEWQYFQQNLDEDT